MYSCALLRDILLQGRLYISRNWLCFYANLFGKDIKVSGPTDWLPCSSPVFPSKITNTFQILLGYHFSQYCSELITCCWISRTSSPKSLNSKRTEPISILMVWSYIQGTVVQMNLQLDCQYETLIENLVKNQWVVEKFFGSWIHFWYCGLLRNKMPFEPYWFFGCSTSHDPHCTVSTGLLWLLGKTSDWPTLDLTD